MAVSDWMRSVPDQIARWVPGTYQSLGADGFGFADTRGAARRFFHIDAQSIVLAVLTELAREGKIDRSVLKQADRPLPAAGRGGGRPGRGRRRRVATARLAASAASPGATLRHALARSVVRWSAVRHRRAAPPACLTA